MRRLISAAALAALGLSLVPGLVEARRPPCRGDEIVVADDRPGRGKLCMKKSEVLKAKRICAKLRDDKGRRVNWQQCTCQDGDSVGACGD